MADTPGDDHTLRPDEVDNHHIDVQEAEGLFNELSKTLSRHSGHGTERPDPSSIAPSGPRKDIEKGDFDDEDTRFDLREYLQSSNDANQAAGIKHKHVGVTWKDLEVRAFGGDDDKVSIDRVVVININNSSAAVLCPNVWQ